MTAKSPTPATLALWAHNEAARRGVSAETVLRIIRVENKLVDEIEDEEGEE